jgi:hypothetical protein
MKAPNYGHWINLLAGHHNFDSMEMIRQLLPDIKGFLFHHPWAEFDRGGVFDFSRLLAQLDWCADRGLMAVVMPKDKTFDAKLPNPVPTHLQQHSAINRPGGFSAIRWAPPIVDEFSRLLERLSRFQTHPAFEGIMLTETAPSLDGELLEASGYTPEVYGEVYRRWLGMVDCRIFWQANFIPPRNEGEIITRVMNASGPHVKLGGPDVLPTNKPLLERAYPVWRAYTDNFVTLSVPSYEVAGWPIRAVAEYARIELRCTRLFWTYRDLFSEQAKVIADMKL